MSFKSIPRKFILFFFVSSSFLSAMAQNGRIVNLDSAQACIDRFPAFMATHGFAAQAGLPFSCNLTTTSQITTGESFSGKELEKWLNQTLAAYKSAGKTLTVKVALGVYDQAYLNTYAPNAATGTALNGRIAIFLIPTDAATGMAVKALAAPAGSGGGGGTGYDFGGVQP